MSVVGLLLCLYHRFLPPAVIIFDVHHHYLFMLVLIFQDTESCPVSSLLRLSIQLKKKKEFLFCIATQHVLGDVANNKGLFGLTGCSFSLTLGADQVFQITFPICVINSYSDNRL